MRIEKLDLAFTALILAFGLWILISAISLGITGPEGPGPGTFPMIAGVLVTVFATAELVRAVLRRRRRADPAATEAAPEEERIGLAELLKIGGILVLVAIYVGLFPILGAFLPLPFLMMGISLIIDWRTDPGWLAALVVLCLVFTVACYFIFSVFLRVLLPEGPFGF